jgi:DNA gyrase subunit A
MDDINKDITEVLTDKFSIYANMVLEDRALPDARDGLKPSQRRILVAMNDLGLSSRSGTEKCAKICGDTSGNYHPHGEAVVYPTLVRLIQEWSMREPLLIGQGNFGSRDGDPQAAMRYCITAGHKIVTPTGKLIEISTLANKCVDGEKEININIVNADGKYSKASKVFACGKHPVKKIITIDGFEIEGTYNHPLLVLEASDNGPVEKWKLIEDIRETDYLILKRGGYDYKYSKVSQKKLDMAYLLGAFVSEGYCVKKHFTFGNTDKEYFDNVVDKYRKNIDTNFKIAERIEKSGKKYWNLETNCSKNLEQSELFQLFSKYSEDKSVPKSIWNGSWEEKRIFLTSLFEGDGCISMLEECVLQIAYSTKSNLLAKDVQQLLLLFGIMSRVYFDKNRKQYTVYTGNISDCEIFAKNIGFTSKKITLLTEKIKFVENCRRGMVRDFVPHLSEYVRKSKFLKYSNRDRIIRTNIDRLNKTQLEYEELSNFIEDAYVKNVYLNLINKKHNFYSKVDSIVETGEKEVFSIKVESDCHSFIANGFINHNTESKLSKFGDALLEDLSEDTVPFQINYNEKRREPTVLPGKIPNLLINGCQGIAVGWATNIPPHNYKEISKVVEAYILNPDLSISELISIMPGPDFSTGGKILGQDGILDYYKTGRGSIKLEGKWNVETSSKGIKSIIVTELPYQASPEQLALEIEKLVKEDELKDVSDLKNLSSGANGIKVVIEISKNGNVDLVLNNLLKNTCMRKSFSVNQTVLVNGKVIPEAPVLLLVKTFVNHRRCVLSNKFKAELVKHNARIHILDGLINVSNNIDQTVKIVRNSDSPEDAVTKLISNKVVETEIQAKAVLAITLNQLTKLENNKLLNEKNVKLERIAELNIILADSKKIDEIVVKEQLELSEKIGSDRKTVITTSGTDIQNEDLIKNEKVIISLTSDGYVKSTNLESFKIQGRGGKGVIGGKEDDIFELCEAQSKNYLLFFTNLGNVYKRKVYQIPQMSKTAKGTHSSNLLELSENETVTNMINVKSLSDSGYLIIVTEKGLIKKSEIKEYDSNRVGGLTAIKLNEGDAVNGVVATDGQQDIFIITKNGNCVRYSESILSVQGRTTQGSKALKLKSDDSIVQVFTIPNDKKPDILVVTTGGFAKRSSSEDYRAFENRNVSGYCVMKKQSFGKNGSVAAGCIVEDGDSIIIATAKGKVIRVDKDSVRQTARSTAGVKAVNLEDGDTVIKIAKVNDNI